jgi:hypothetical protein
MSGERSTVEKSVEEILVDLMTERVMSVGIQASSTGDCKHPHRLDDILATLLRSEASTATIWLTQSRSHVGLAGLHPTFGWRG